MKKQVLFIHGGDDDGYNTDKELAAALQKELGNDHQVIYPQMPDDNTPDFGWLNAIGEEIGKLDNDAVWAGHSLGASMLLKYLSENKVLKKAAGIFLLAPPFWSGEEDWKQGLILQKNFAESLPANIPVFFYHCRDDKVVPLSHLTTYKQKLPEAAFREFESGGHQLDNQLNQVSEDIKAL